MANTFYTCMSVLQAYIKAHNWSISNFTLENQSPNRVAVWLDENPEGVTKLVCYKVSLTQFIIWAYNSNYEEIKALSTSFDYSDVNTPPLEPYYPF